MSIDRARGIRPRRALQLVPFVFSGLVALVTTLVLAEHLPAYAPGLLRFEHSLGDVRTAYLADRLPSQHPRIAVVGITDATLQDLPARLPIDADLLARTVAAIDAAGATSIGIDLLFTRYTGSPAEQRLVETLRAARAKIVLAADDERIGLDATQAARHRAFLQAVGSPAGFVNLATERDWIVRFKAGPPAGKTTPSFSAQLAQEAGADPRSKSPRIAWLGPPQDGTDTFLTVPAHALLGPETAPTTRASKAGLSGKMVILGGLFPDIDVHLTPLTARTHERMSGALIHAHMLAEQLDGRSIGQPDATALPVRLVLALLAALGFLTGWGLRHTRKGLIAGSIISAVIIAVDIMVFWQLRIIVPLVLALLAWLIGEIAGHYLGRLFGRREKRV